MIYLSTNQHPITDNTLYNKVLICCDSNKWLSFVDIFRNLEFTFKIRLQTYVEKKQILDTLVKAGHLRANYERDAALVKYKYMRIIPDSSALEVAFVLNMLCEVLGQAYHSVRHIRQSVIRAFNKDITTRLKTNELYEVVYWLDYLVFSGRATRMVYNNVVTGNGYEDFYGRFPNDPTKRGTIGFSRSGYQSTTEIETTASPRCPQARI